MYVISRNSCATYFASQYTVSKQIINRRTLTSSNNKLKPLYGPEEIKRAKKIVKLYSVGNAITAAATAQEALIDKLVLSGIEIAMATHILNGIYDFKLPNTILKAIMTVILGKTIGTSTFSMITASSFSWVPFLGNGLNAAIAGGTTALLGSALIYSAEEMDKRRKRGEKIDKFIKEMEDEDKKP